MQILPQYLMTVSGGAPSISALMQRRMLVMHCIASGSADMLICAGAQSVHAEKRCSISLSATSSVLHAHT